jgi:predicted ATPase
VAPLALPHTDALDAVASAPASALFVDRARSTTSGFDLSPTDAAVVADVVRLLDGLPLAIEFNAAQLRVLSLSGLRERVASSLDALTGALADLPGRRATPLETSATLARAAAARL